MASAANHSKTMVLSLFIVAPIVCGSFMLGPCFVMQCLVSFLVLQSSCQEREGWLLYFYCLLDVIRLLLFFVSSSQCRRLVCSVQLWHFLILLTYLLIIIEYDKPFGTKGESARFCFFPTSLINSIIIEHECWILIIICIEITFFDKNISRICHM